MKFKTYYIPIIVILLVAVVFISGCVQTPEPTPSTTQPSETLEKNTTTTQPQESDCTPDWQCSAWSECSQAGTQTRTCTDKNDCGVTTNKPSESQSCTPSVVEPEPITITGRGSELTNAFQLEKGLTTIYLTHDGDRNFIVDLLDSDGDSIGWGVNEIGEYQGSKAIHIEKKGDYYLNVEADGNWEAIVKQPRNIDPTNLPHTFQGNGANAENFFYAEEGLHKITLTHDGDSNFIVDVLEEDGSSSGWWGVNEIGEFEGSKALKIEETGIYLLYVQLADGNWEITIE